jgi:hypothetical protein
MERVRQDWNGEADDTRGENGNERMDGDTMAYES